MIEYIYIDRQDQLDLAISQLDKADFLSVDTESSSFYTYYSELCLIQISSNRLHLVIDALASLDLSGLGKLFNGLSILKIFHDAPADMTELHRRYHWPIHRIFDTHLAAKYLNHESCSLLALAKYYIGVQLEKKEQKSNWLKRPLSKSQLDYAHLDTLYLQPIQDQMTASLKKSNLYIEFESEMDWLVSNLDFTNTKEESDPANDWLKVKGASKLLP
ncbi:MAG: ribonuclease D, partial [Leptonema sp. (in: Bacteria)]|nr:ribonuclease D [Leptonema sp. (in: bacteria)]